MRPHASDYKAWAERSSEIASSRRYRNRQYKKEVEEGFLSFLLFMCPYSLVCILYAVCMHPQLHTFTAPQPYGHAYSRFCMHCMQSIPELCSRIACIVGFLMHTMHTSFSTVHPSNEADGTDGLRTRPQGRVMIVG